MFAKSLIAISFIISVFFTYTPVSAFARWTHQNLPEEGLLYMEFQGTNQMRWAADYMKAKAEGRYTGLCWNINYPPEEMDGATQIQCGAAGVARIGGVKPDYFWDAFWDDFLFYSWHVPDMGLYSNNFTSWYHFVNLLKTNEDGDSLVTNNYNKYDGYGYNATYGFPNLGIDFTLATFMNNAQMTVYLPGCTHSNCSDWQGISAAYRANPAVDYMQNDSTTPISGGSGSKRTEQTDGMNYNCFSDVTLIGNCPDNGAEQYGSTQIPNVVPGGGHILSGDEDWVIYEPATNAATFYYNEMFLEGLQSKNHSLQTTPIVNRYYNIGGTELLYFTVVQHWMGDMAQQAHVWSTIGFNHGEYESYADDTYGKRRVGESTGNNLEDYTESQAYANSWQNRYTQPVGNIDRLLMEQAFRTYHIHNRLGYNFMASSDQNGVWRPALIWAIRNATAAMALVKEKAIIDLRKCRNSPVCNEY
ncbi:MAG: hypothetical protein LDLANPLL_00538 [Turneriella sp.]|nr:hypothetical protein [Turneriella sp.]